MNRIEEDTNDEKIFWFHHKIKSEEDDIPSRLKWTDQISFVNNSFSKSTVASSIRCSFNIFDSIFSKKIQHRIKIIFTWVQVHATNDISDKFFCERMLIFKFASRIKSVFVIDIKDRIYRVRNVKRF